MTRNRLDARVRQLERLTCASISDPSRRREDLVADLAERIAAQADGSEPDRAALRDVAEASGSSVIRELFRETRR